MRLPLLLTTLLIVGCNARLNLPPGDAVVGVAVRLFVSAPAQVAIYTCAAFTLQSQDATGLAAAVAQTTSVALSGLGTGEAFASLADCRAHRLATTTLFLGAGQSSQVFYYRTSLGETLTLRAQSATLAQAETNLTTVQFQGMGQASMDTVFQMQKGEQYPTGVWTDGTRLFVADRNNNRVLGWNALPTVNSQAPDFVLGQPDFASSEGAVSATRMNTPWGVFSDGVRLFVADSGNNRVLVWNAVPSTTGIAADFALGQSGLTSNTSGSTSTTMSFPSGVYSDGTRVFVADQYNHRVLVWSSMPSSNGQAAAFALGQTSLSGSLSNRGGAVSGGTLNYPSHVSGYGTRLFVADSSNNRVLVWTTLPTGNGQAAGFALGQADLLSSTANRGGAVAANTLNVSYGVASDGTRLFVTDAGNHRVLVWNDVTLLTGGKAADFALGQSDLTSSNANQGGVSAHSLYYSVGVAAAGGHLFVADFDNCRTLSWTTMPSSSGADAELVLGQPNMSSNAANSTGASATSLYYAGGVASDGTRLFVADTYNHRVLVWNQLPISSFQGADLALGQPDLVSNAPNGGGVSAASLQGPWGVSTDGTRLYVADTGNNRVLVWSHLPTVSGQPADFALGQPNLISNGNNGGVASATSMKSPSGVYSNGIQLYVADTSNNRVLVWNSLPTTSGQPADFVLGQANLNANVAFTVGPNAMADPFAVSGDGTHLFVADTYNNRVLIWNSLPTSSQPASLALGQLDLNSNADTFGTASATSLEEPFGVHSDGTHLFVADTVNNRVLIWNSLPTTNDQPADAVLGQPDMTSRAVNNGGISATSLQDPYGMYSDGIRLFVADEQNFRITIFALP